MEELKKQVIRAHRRLTFQRFLTVLAWTLFVSFFIAAIAIAVPKIWAIGVDSQQWMTGWLIGAGVLGLLSAIAWLYATRKSPLDAAIEIDRRFGLKERVSSTFAMSDAELSSEAGEALVKDASRRVERLDVREQFQFEGRWLNLLPALPILLAFLLTLIPNAITKETQTAEASTLAVKKQIQKSTDELKKKWAEKRKKAAEKNLKSAELFLNLEKAAGEMNKIKDVDKKKAMVKLNDLADEIKKRRNQVGDMDELKKQLNQMKNLKPGPAAELSKALKTGDFKKAIDEIKDMQKQLADGKMSETDAKKLSEQLNKMAEAIKQKAAAHEMAKQDLKKQIEQAKKQGQNSKAGQLQKKLDKMNAQNQQMKKMQQMAQKMAQCSKCAGEGKGKEAAEKMEALAADLEEMAEALEELDMLDDAMEQLADAKDQMRDGMGQGMGMGGKIPGNGLGEGQGQGDRPEAETDKSFYDSKVKGKVRKAKAVVTGFASGKNIAGEAQEEVREALEAARTDASDPLTNVRLPKEHRDHAREYFDSLNK